MLGFLNYSLPIVQFEGNRLLLLIFFHIAKLLTYYFNKLK